MAEDFRNIDLYQPLPLTEPADLEPSVHRWSEPELDALTLALAAGRPLLVRGEPGTGKTQLARAAAQHLCRQLLTVTIHPRFEPEDLIARYDPVRRLADAQRGQGLPDGRDAEADYWEPGVLWRAYAPDSARRYGSRPPPPSDGMAGHVILIDEIDKADGDLPNSLLEVLGQRVLYVPPLRERVGLHLDRHPLVIVTTNEEREVPDAFLRRCIVLNLGPAADYCQWVRARALTHFDGHHGRPFVDPRVIDGAIDQLLRDREALPASAYKPGAAELLDLLRALHRLAPGQVDDQQRWLGKLSGYSYIKVGSPRDGLGTPVPSQQRRQT
jgi:MoxR-like ATPase